MKSSWFIYTILSLSTSVLAQSDPKPYTLQHRLSSWPSWSNRGLLLVDSTNVTTSTSDPSQADPVTIASVDGVSVSFQNLVSSKEMETFRSIGKSDGSELYQLRLVAGHASQDVSNAVGPSSFVRGCHLAQSSSLLPTIDDLLVIHLRDSVPYAFNYRIQDITLAQNGCPIPSDTKLKAVEEQKKKQRQKNVARRSRRKSTSIQPLPDQDDRFRFHTQFLVTVADKPKNPPLAEPIPMREDGTAQEKQPEKPWFLKYWYLIVPMVLVLLLSPADDDDKSKGAEAHSSSSQPKAQGQAARRIK